MLVPTDGVRTHYGQMVLGHLCTSFQSVHVVRVRARLFADADVSASVVHCRGFGGGPTTVVHLVRDEVEAQRPRRPAADVSLSSRSDPIFEGSLGPRPRRLGELAQIRIGVVTGANDFFVRSHDEATRLQVSGVEWIPTVNGGRPLRGAVYRTADRQLHEGSGVPAFLLSVHSREALRSSRLREELECAAALGIPDRTKCAARSPWYKLDLLKRPHGFFQYSASSPKGVVQNKTAATCTNSLFALRRKNLSPTVDTWIASTWTTLFGLSLERRARPLGNGGLRVDPRILSDAPVFLIGHAGGPAINSIDWELRHHGHAAARAAADEIVLRREVGIKQRLLDSIRAEFAALCDFRNRESSNG
jgi:adenine-specific DNA-methyltransferase